MNCIILAVVHTYVAIEAICVYMGINMICIARLRWASEVHVNA